MHFLEKYGGSLAAILSLSIFPFTIIPHFGNSLQRSKRFCGPATPTATHLHQPVAVHLCVNSVTKMTYLLMAGVHLVGDREVLGPGVIVEDIAARNLVACQRNWTPKLTPLVDFGFCRSLHLLCC